MSDLTRDKLIEVMARASWEAESFLDWEDDATAGPYRDGWRKRQSAALDAIGALAAVVPREAIYFDAGFVAAIAAAGLTRPAVSTG